MASAQEALVVIGVVPRAKETRRQRVDYERRSRNGAAWRCLTDRTQTADEMPPAQAAVLNMPGRHDPNREGW